MEAKRQFGVPGYNQRYYQSVFHINKVKLLSLLKVSANTNKIIPQQATSNKQQATSNININININIQEKYHGA